jgi:hypothetical protein
MCLSVSTRLRHLFLLRAQQMPTVLFPVKCNTIISNEEMTEFFSSGSPVMIVSICHPKFRMAIAFLGSLHLFTVAGTQLIRSDLLGLVEG